ncbi:MAG: DUF3823 domain-containing protein [Bacteroidales bacterium]|nr:DUF3823 domain-containing protein [Bacteroidales bacterium]
MLLGVAVMTSCELDNYDFPESSIQGALIDLETGETIQSDIYDGARIPLIEIHEDYENPQTRYLIIKTDGTFRNDLMFDGLYAVPAIEDGNFHPTDSTSITIDGDTEVDFPVLPYIRITDVVMTMDGMTLTADFKLEQTVPDSINIMDVTLFAHSEPTVGKPHRFDDNSKFINAAAVPDSVYSVSWDMSRSRKLSAGKAYFFRIGAKIDLPTARYNYAPAERFTLTKN